MSEMLGAYTALVTPFESDGGKLDLDSFEQLIRLQASGGVRGVVPCGTTGESPTLGIDEHRTLVGTAVDLAHSLGLEVIAGAGSNVTAHAVELHKTVCALGADAALHVAPYYNRPSQEGLYRHFMTIADSAELPIVLYDVPSRCGVSIDVDTIVRLSEHPNIRGLKAASGSTDMVTEVVTRCDLAVLSGDDTMTLPMMAVGARGVISVLSNIVPREVASMCRAVREGRFGDALAIHQANYDLARDLLSLDVNPVPVKTALQLLGISGAALRQPLAPASAEVQKAIAGVLEKAGLAPVVMAVQG